MSNEIYHDCDLQSKDSLIKMPGFPGKVVCKLWLDNIKAFRVKLPKGIKDKIFDISFVQAVNTTNVKYIDHMNGYKMIFKQPIYYNKTHRVIPGYPQLAINNDGTSLINITTGNALSLVDKNQGYSIAYHDNRTTRVHRLVALAWVVNLAPIIYHVVNHKDSVRDNNHWGNLEWGDTRYNNLHAASVGAVPSSIQTRVRNILTSEIKCFETIGEACRYMGITVKGGNTQRFIDRKVTSVVNDIYEVRLAGDTRGWHYINSSEVESHRKYKFTVTHPSGEVEVIHGSVEFIKRFKLWNLGVPADKLAEIASARNPELEFQLDGNNGVIPVQMYNISTKEVIEYPSMAECARANNFHRSTVRTLTRSVKRTVYKGHVFRYKSDDPWVIDSNIAPPKKAITATHINGTALNFTSERAAAAYIDVDRSVLKTAARNNEYCKDYKIKYN